MLLSLKPLHGSSLVRSCTTIEQPSLKQPHLQVQLWRGELIDGKNSSIQDVAHCEACLLEYHNSYYNNDNVILSCKDKDTLFHIHHSILAKYCPVLSGLISRLQWPVIVSSFANLAVFTSQYNTCTKCLGHISTRMKQILSRLWGRYRMFYMTCR